MIQPFKKLACILAIFLSAQLICLAKTFDEYLSTGQFKEGIADYTARAEKNKNNQEIFSLALLQFFGTVEQLAQSLHDCGLNGQGASLPFVRIPVPKNTAPKEVTALDLRGVLDNFYAGLEKTNKTLGTLQEGAFVVPVDFGKIKLYVKEAKGEKHEIFQQLYLVYNREARGELAKDKSFVINFDNGDGYWLKGYTHLLMGITDILLAHDGGDVFNYTAPFFFPSAKTSFKGVLSNEGQLFDSPKIAEIIAAVHMFKMEVIDPARLSDARLHLLEVLNCSRASWKFIEAETDDAREWIPNAKQTSVLGVRFSQEMIDGWKVFLAEAGDILEGKKLVPHWRVSDGRGINLKKVFAEPRALDFILWAHGASAIPYLEKGTLTSGETWARLEQLFQGNFIGFAIWVN